MSSKHIKFSKKNGVGVITLNKPDRLNAIDPAMRDELGVRLKKAADDDSVKVVVLTGAGRAFCAGGDMKTMGGRLKKNIIDRRDNLRVSNKMIHGIREMDKPVIAAINGVAVGAGLNLALACDIRLASDKARLGQIFVKRGLHPDWGGIYNLTRLVGTAKACEMVFTGDMVDAHEAKRIGLINQVYPDNEFKNKWKEFAQKIADNAPLPIKMAKIAIHKADNVDYQTVLELEAFSQALVSQTEDAKEGVKAFSEKRKPEFKGR